MPKLSQAVPKYRKHKPTGQAVVTMAGVHHYLGPHGSQASILQYDRFIAEYLAGGRKFNPNRTITINELAVEFLGHAESYDVKDGKPTTELGAFQRVMRTLCRTYGDQPVTEFGPLARMIECATRPRLGRRPSNRTRERWTWCRRFCGS